MKITSALIDRLLGKTVALYAREGHSFLGNIVDMTHEYIELLVVGKVGVTSSTINEDRTVIVASEDVIGIVIQPKFG